MKTRPGGAVLAWVGVLVIAGCRREPPPAPATPAAAPPAVSAADEARLKALEQALELVKDRLARAEAERDRWRREAEAARERPAAPASTAASGPGRPEAPTPAPGTAAIGDPQWQRDLIRKVLLVQDNERWAALRKLGIEVTSADFRAMLEGVDLKDGRRQGEVYRVLPQWAQFDPAAAAEWVQNCVTNAEPRWDFLYNLVASQWVNKDPEAMYRWARQLPAGRQRDSAIQQYVWRTAQQDPKRAAEAASTIADANVRSSTVPMIAGQWANRDLGEALSWVAGMAAGRERDQAIQQITQVVSRTNAVTAIEYAASIDDEGMRYDASSWAVGQWARQDLEAAARWVNSLPQGRLRDLCAMQMSGQIAQTQPESAAEWAESIGDLQLRESAVRGIAWQWMRRDRTAATNWIQRSSSMSASVKQSLLQQAEQMRTWTTVGAGGTVTVTTQSGNATHIQVISQ